MNGGGGAPAPRVSDLIVDADLVIPAAYKLTSDHIAETTAGHKVVVDSELAPAENVTIAGGKILKADHAAETTGAHGFVLDSNTVIATGKTLDSVDAAGSFGANIKPQTIDMLGVVMGG